MKVYRLANNFNSESIFGGANLEPSVSPEGNTFFPNTDGSKDSFAVRQPRKFISVPILTDFRNNGYQDLINRLAEEEKQKNVNTVIDRETIKYTSANLGTQTQSNLSIKFIFFDKDQQTYGSDWLTAGFTQEEISESRNALTKSFFRLDFYDSIDQNNSNYLFSEFLNVNLNQTTTFPFSRLYWLKNDPKFIEEKTLSIHSAISSIVFKHGPSEFPCPGRSIDNTLKLLFEKNCSLNDQTI